MILQYNSILFILSRICNKEGAAPLEYGCIKYQHHTIPISVCISNYTLRVGVYITFYLELLFFFFILQLLWSCCNDAIFVSPFAAANCLFNCSRLQTLYYTYSMDNATLTLHLNLQCLLPTLVLSLLLFSLGTTITTINTYDIIVCFIFNFKNENLQLTVDPLLIRC